VDLAAAVAAGDPDQAALFLRRGLQVDLERGGGRKPADDHHQGPDREDQGPRWKSAYGDKVVVDFCMRYGNPRPSPRCDELVAQGCTKILFFPLYPQYAGATSATACDEFFRALQNIKWQPIARTVEPYYEHPLYIEALAQSVERAYAGLENRPDVLVASYHGVPKRYLMEGDPYHCQCQKTSRLLKERLGWADTEIVTTFQSRFGPEEWLKPYTVEEVARLAEQGKKRIAVRRRPSAPIASRRWKRSTKRSAKASRRPGARSSPTSPASTTTTRISTRCPTVVSENLKGWI
jgi:ferrochelatase